MNTQIRVFRGSRRLGVALLLVTVLVLIVGLRPTDQISAGYPGTNGKIVFTSWRTGNGDIYVMEADGSNLNLLHTSTGEDMLPAWSPQGYTLAFRGGTGIYLMDQDGNNVRALVGNGSAPSWSPDGQQIVFERNDGGVIGDIYVINVDGTGLTQLTTHNEREMAPVWSPDGSQIAYHRQIGDVNDEIYVMDADGLNQTRLTTNTAQDYYADWSPDGSRIVFVSTRDGDAELFIMDADGTDPVQLTHDTYIETYPAWSPDGAKIVYTVYKGDESSGDIYTINIDGTGIQRLTSTNDLDDHADWQPITSLGPVAISDSYAVYADRTMTIPSPGVLDNDLNFGGPDPQAILDVDTAKGDLNLMADGGFTYVPTPGFIGQDTFSYHIFDGSQNSNITVVNIDVKSDFPVAVPDDYYTVSDRNLEVPASGVLENDSDPEDQPLTAVLVDDATHGTLVLTPDGAFTYVPDGGFVGHDLFTYQAYDGFRSSPPTTVTIDVRLTDWVMTGSMNIDRWRHTATRLLDGRVLVTGGLTGPEYDEQLATAELYDPATGAWTYTGSMAASRSGHSAVLLSDGRVLITGGIQAELYDPASGQFSSAGNVGFNLPLGHRSVVLADGRVLVTDGAKATLFDPTVTQWAEIGSLNVAHVNSVMTLLADGRVLLAGRSGEAGAPSAELYDPGTGDWTTTGNMVYPRYYASAVRLADGRVLVAGGDNGYDEVEDAEWHPEIYNPASGTWQQAGTLHYAHGGGTTLTVLLDGRVLLVGGAAMNHFTAEIYNPAVGIWSLTGELHRQTYDPAAALLADGRVLVTNGVAGAELFNPVRAQLDGRIVYADQDYGHIWVMNADGSNPVDLTGPHGLGRANPVWSPDGSRIAYDQPVDSTQEMQVWLMNADGGNPTRLTTDSDRYNGRAAWSPDGTQLAFESMRDENSDIYIISAAGGAPVNITNNPAEDSFPDWSPDGSRIVFASDRSGDTELYTMNVDGSELTRITSNPGWDGDPRWSPDGTQVAFYTEGGDIWLVGADGGNLVNLTNTPTIREFSPAWSPDGTKLVFAVYEDRPGPNDRTQLYGINRDGTGRYRLTFDPWNDYAPDWWAPADADADGVDAPTEGNAPNNGDGNNDGTPDSQQANVASLPNSADGAYITLAAPDGTMLEGVAASANPSPDDTPPGAEFPIGFVNFHLALAETGGAVQVTLFLEGGDIPETYYKYGPTPDNPADHWYEFLYDGTTGAEILADRIVLHFVDGLRGDGDLTADGDIDDPGAPARRVRLYLSPTGIGKVAGKSFTGADILSYDKATNTWDVFYDGSYIGTPKNVGAFTFRGGGVILGFSAAQVLPGPGTAAPQDLVRFTPTRTGYNNTAGTFAVFFDGSDVGLTTSSEIIDALWIDPTGRLYISTAGTAKVPGPGGSVLTAQDEDVLRFTPTGTGATTAGTWELYWNPTALTGMSAEDINGYWENAATGDRYVTILGAFAIGNAAYGGRFSGNGKTILRFVPNAAAPGAWAPAEKVVWLAPGATFPSNLDGIEMGR